MDERLIAGRYALNEPLGGSSWRATDTELGREVVVRLGTSGATGAALLSHPSIARVFDHGEADGERFVVREYLPGGSLEERGAASLSEDAAQVAASDVAAALAYAHGQGVAHGALSEANVLFDAEDRAKVADFTAEGEPQDDVLAFGAILQSLATAAPALGPVAAAALAGELDSSELAARLDDIRPVAAAAAEPTTVIAAPRAAPPEPTPAGRRRVVAAVAIAAALLVAGLGAAYFATSDGSDTTEPTTEAPSGPTTGESTEEETEAPPPTTTADSTDATTTGTTTADTSTEQTTTAPPATTTEPPPTTTEPPATTEPPPATTTEPPPTTTEPPPPTTTEEPPPTTTEATTTEAG